MDFISLERSAPLIDLRRPILVSLESFVALKEAQVVNDDASEITIPLIQLDTLSRNKAEYPADDLIRSIKESRYVQENYAQKTWFGELEHPPQGSPMERFMYVEPTRYAWLIKEYKIQHDMIIGRCAFVPPLGDAIPQKIIAKHGSNYAASLRAYTPTFVKKQGPNGEYIIKKYPMYPVTFDCVTTPGLYKARMVDPDKYPSLAQGRESVSAMGRESSPHFVKNIIFDNPEESLRKMICSEGRENLRILEDLFGFDSSTSKLVINARDQVEVITSENTKIQIPLNNYLVGQALGSLKK